MTGQTSKKLIEIRDTIKSQVKLIDDKAFSDSIITLNLKMANEKFGEGVKNEFIDEFELEKYGWLKKGEIKRYGEFDFNKPK